MAKGKKKKQQQRPRGDKPHLTEKERREVARQRIEERRRRKMLRLWGIVGVVVLAGVGFLVVREVLDRRAQAAYEELAAGAGCGEIRKVGGLSGDHIDPPAPPPTYETEPPAGGPHLPSTLPARVYSTAFSENIAGQEPSIYAAVHSLEHGYVIVWHDNLSEEEQNALASGLRDDLRKVIVVPYPKLDDGQQMALTAWGVLQYCEEADPGVAEAFVERYRERTGPESTQP